MRGFKTHLETYFENIGQAFFMKDWVFGALLLALFLAFDRYFFYCGVIASLVGYGYTALYPTPKLLRSSGLMTLNGFFFGIAMASLFKPSPFAVTLMVLGSLTIPLLTKATFDVVQHWKLSPFVLPYILSIWITWLCGKGGLEVRHDLWPEIIATLPPIHPEWHWYKLVGWASAQAAGRLLFLPNSLFGAAITLLILLRSPRRGIFFLLGTLLATALAFLLTGKSAAWEYGFFSFCGGLVALGLASSPEKLSWRTILLFAAFSTALTVAVDGFLRDLKLPTLSFPYILCMWVAVLSRVPRISMSWSQGSRPISAILASPAALKPDESKQRQLERAA